MGQGGGTPGGPWHGSYNPHHGPWAIPFPPPAHPPTPHNPTCPPITAQVVPHLT
nr:unnamed protein product [Digitaria exilis]